MTSARPLTASPDPSEIRPVRLLKDDGFAETRLVEFRGERWLHKTHRLRFWWGRPFGAWARRQARHEMEVCRLLAGIDGVASEFIQVDGCSFLRRWVDGMDLKQRKRIGRRPGNAFFEELTRIVEAVHARGVAYNDLAKQDNVIVTEDDRPVLIDFQISMRAYRGRNPLRRAFSSWLIRQLQYEDLRHAMKLKRRVRPDLLTAEERGFSRRKPLSGRLFRSLFSVPLRTLKRLIYPKASNETFRFRRRDRSR